MTFPKFWFAIFTLSNNALFEPHMRVSVNVGLRALNGAGYPCGYSHLRVTRAGTRICTACAGARTVWGAVRKKLYQTNSGQKLLSLHIFSYLHLCAHIDISAQRQLSLHAFS